MIIRLRHRIGRGRFIKPRICPDCHRICYMMELDPHYADVIIERWEKFTGEKAVKIKEAAK